MIKTLTVLWKLAPVVFSLYPKGIEMLKIENVHEMSKAGYFGSKFESNVILFIKWHNISKTMVCYAFSLNFILQNIAGSQVPTRSNDQVIDHSGKDSILGFSNIKNGRTDTKYTYAERKVIEDKLALSPIVVRAKLLKLNKKNKKTNQTRKVLLKRFLLYECKFQKI